MGVIASSFFSLLVWFGRNKTAAGTKKVVTKQGGLAAADDEKEEEGEENDDDDNDDNDETQLQKKGGKKKWIKRWKARQTVSGEAALLVIRELFGPTTSNEKDFYSLLCVLSYI